MFSSFQSPKTTNLSQLDFLKFYFCKITRFTCSTLLHNSKNNYSRIHSDREWCLEKLAYLTFSHNYTAKNTHYNIITDHKLWFDERTIKRVSFRYFYWHIYAPNNFPTGRIEILWLLYYLHITQQKVWRFFINYRNAI